MLLEVFELSVVFSVPRMHNSGAYYIIVDGKIIFFLLTAYFIFDTVTIKDRDLKTETKTYQT